MIHKTALTRVSRMFRAVQEIHRVWILGSTDVTCDVLIYCTSDGSWNHAAKVLGFVRVPGRPIVRRSVVGVKIYQCNQSSFD